MSPSGSGGASPSENIAFTRAARALSAASPSDWTHRQMARWLTWGPEQLLGDSRRFRLQGGEAGGRSLHRLHRSGRRIGRSHPRDGLAAGGCQGGFEPGLRLVKLALPLRFGLGGRGEGPSAALALQHCGNFRGHSRGGIEPGDRFGQRGLGPRDGLPFRDVRGAHAVLPS